MQRRKPPKRVITISREPHKDDAVYQWELEAVAELQADAWKAEKRAQRAAAKIESRLAHGASTERGKYYFDRELGMARSRKERVG